MQDTPKIKKIELEHKKLLTEYNSILVALATVTIGIGGLTYSITSNIFLTIFSLTTTFLILNSEKESKPKELKNKVQEIEWSQ